MDAIDCRVDGRARGAAVGVAVAVVVAIDEITMSIGCSQGISIVERRRSAAIG